MSAASGEPVIEQVEQFIEGLIEGPSLRADFRRAPKETAERAGLDLSADDLKALQTIDWGDKELLAGASRRTLMSECSISDVNIKENFVPIRWD
jgi:hypothetical protein